MTIEMEEEKKRIFAVVFLCIRWNYGKRLRENNGLIYNFIEGP